MIALSLMAKLVIAALLVGSIVQAFFGRTPSRRPSSGILTALLVAGLACYVGGLGALMAGSVAVCSLLVVLAVEVMCLGVWLGRAGADGGDGGDSPRPEPDDQPPSFDWDDFERKLRDWERGRDRDRVAP